MLQTATEVRHVESAIEIFSKRYGESGCPAPLIDLPVREPDEFVFHFGSTVLWLPERNCP
jgi:hypothetical protein